MSSLNRERFEKAQRAYIAAVDAMRVHECERIAKVGEKRWRTERLFDKRYAALGARRDRAVERVFAVLKSSPRDWENRTPFDWVCRSLTYEDAVRPVSEPLSVVPPLAL